MHTVSLKALLMAVIVVATASQAAAEIRWQESLRAAHTKAQAENKLLLLHFYSDNCVWCDRLEKGTFQSEEVASAIDQNFVALKVHAGKNPQLVKMFNVTAFPTDVVVTTESKTLSHSVSPQDPKRFIAMLHKTISSGVQTPTTPPQTALAAQVPQSSPNEPQASAPMVSVSNALARTGNVQGQLTSSRSDNTGFEFPDSQPSMTTTTPESSNVSTASSTTTESTNPATPTQPELAMEGYCAVTVISEDRWVEGKAEFGVIHLGKLYLFASAEAMQSFLADPVTYTPVLNEIDVVRFFEERRIVPGKREWGLKDPTHNRMFFFADEAAMNHFWNEYQRYTDAAIAVMDAAVKDANPES